MTNDQQRNIFWHDYAVTTRELEALHGHQGVTIWFTGLPGSGKSTLANMVARKLLQFKVSTVVLDGDNIRFGLNRDLGFSPAERKENIRRVGELARLFTSAAIVNLTAFISPYRSDRRDARALQPETFIEVHCAASLAACEQRDPKGLYKKARAGKLIGLTGIDAPYEIPETPEIRIDTGKRSVYDCVDDILRELYHRGIIFTWPLSKFQPTDLFVKSH